MGEHFVIKNIRRSITEAQSRKGVLVGLPEIRVPASHAEVLLGEIDRLRSELERLNQMLHQTSRSNAELIGEVIQEARKQAAQEIIEDVIGDWNCDCGYGGLVIADAIKAKFKLEGEG